MGWQEAGAAWGARAADWASFQEPFHANSYDAVLAEHEVRSGTTLLDVGCGAGLALRKAAHLGATVRGIDASQALLAIAAERAPAAELHCGDMAELPWPDASVDLVMAINVFMYGTDAALAEACRVLRPGGRLTMTFWKDAGDYSGYLEVISRCSPPDRDAGSVPVRLSDPGVAEDMLRNAGLDPVSRYTVECVGEYRDRDIAWQGMASPGPAFAAIQHAGEDAFRTALMPVIQRYVSARTGIVRMQALFDHVSAVKPG